MSLLLDKIQFMEELKNRIKQYQNFLYKLKVQDKVRVRLEDSFHHAELKKEDFREGFIEEKKKELERTYNKISSTLWDIDESLDEYDGTPNIDKYLVKNDS